VKKIGSLLLVSSALMLASCVTQNKTATGRASSISSLRLIDVYELPHNLMFEHTTVGGLSGIDYDSTRRLYYLISDDRSALQPARYYSMKLFFTEKKIDSIGLVSVTTLKQQNGKPYPNSKQDPAHTPDPEALRYDPVRKQMIWTSEGERIVKDEDTVLENPAITIIRTDGAYLDTFPIPSNLQMHASENGPRQNGVLEGLSFANNFKTLYVSLEEPLYEDGPRAETTSNNAWVRFYKFDVATKRNTAQYAYLLDPVAYPAITKDAFKINGIPDILSIDGHQLLVMERSYSTGRLACTIKIFLADLNGAVDVSGIHSLKEQPPVHPVNKKLLLNMDSLGMFVDNVEGMTFGPALPNGHKTLLLVTDNNFSALEKTQFFLFEVMP
jgi:hypothetical protein